MNNSIIVANRFLELAETNSAKLTPLQLLKLVYIAHGWMLGINGRSLIRDKVEAWQYGPVIPALYKHLRSYKGVAISGKINSFFAHGELGEDDDDIIRQVYDIYGHITGVRLSRITHASGTPWELTYEPGAFGLTIPVDLIENHYNDLAEKASGHAT